MAAERIRTEVITVISALAPDKPDLWHLREDALLDFWNHHDKYAKKRRFLSEMVGYKLDDSQLVRAAVLCREHVFYQFPVFRTLLSEPKFSWGKCLAMVKEMGPEITVSPLPAGVYKPLPGYLEHEVKSCASVEEVLELDKKLTSHGG